MRIKTTTTETMRERALDSAELKEAIAAEERVITHLRARLEERFDDVDETNLGRALQRVSEYLRLAGRYEDALAAKDEAIALWVRLRRGKASLLTRFQRAVIFHYAGAHQEALEQMDAVIGELEGLTRVYEDVFLEGRARCLWEMERQQEAREEMRRVLMLREQRGNQAHIAKTRQLVVRMGDDEEVH